MNLEEAITHIRREYDVIYREGSNQFIAVPIRDFLEESIPELERFKVLVPVLGAPDDYFFQEHHHSGDYLQRMALHKTGIVLPQIFSRSVRARPFIPPESVTIYVR
ncbi:hypothetical protein D6789_02675 [Candidatus Woesearchaeota archaeon]|nr:MAG: hypothetical protein D6789_02675 [Candidatus Woesearchaeota archaeon]